MKKLYLTIILSVLCCLLFAVPANAAEFTAKVDGAANTDLVTNNTYIMRTKLNAGSKVTITSESDIASFYVVWYKVPGAWLLNDSTEINDGFLHEYIELETPAKSFTITTKEASGICWIKVFAEGETIPDDIQKWQAPQQKTDVMVFSTHADDESLFLGGAMADIIAKHQDANVQLVYMTNHLQLEPYREHERLDALWVYGLKNYPLVGEQADAYAMDSLEAGLAVCDYDMILNWFVDLIKTHKPQVIITQDFNGEYGHAQHMVMTKAVTEAVEKCAADGSHDVAKTYVHLYKDSGAIELDLRRPLDVYGGKTALDVAKEAYTKHASQQKWWFYVSDEYEYSCDEFGLWRTTLAADTGNDMMENIKTYAEQDREEEERRAAEEAANKDKEKNKSKDKEKPTTGKKLLPVYIIGAVILVIGGIFGYLVATAKKRRQRIARQRAMQRQGQRERYVPKHSGRDIQIDKRRKK